MIDVIMCLTANLFRIYMIRKFIQIFVGNERKENHKHLLGYIGFYLINTGLYLFFHLVWINFLCNLVGISLLVFLYTKSIKTNLFVTGSIYLINMGCDTVATLIFVDYQDGQGFNQIYSVLSVFLIFICEILLEKVVNYRKSADVVKNLPLIWVPLCSIAIILYKAFEKDNSDKEIVFICIGMLIINFIVFYLYNMLLIAFSQKYENEILKHKNKIYANQIQIILQSEDKVKSLRHDMKHHMNELKLLAMKNNSEAILEYIDSMKEFINNPNEIVASGNTDIDSVINYMLQRAKKELHTVNLNMQIPEAICHSFDINVILGNLLENAIEAAGRTEEKLLNINIRLKQDVLRIEIENSFDKSQILKKQDNQGRNYFATTKRGKEQHGIGLSSVRSIVEKYDGIMEISPRENHFCVKLILYMSSMKSN